MALRAPLFVRCLVSPIGTALPAPASLRRPSLAGADSRASLIGILNGEGKSKSKSESKSGMVYWMIKLLRVAKPRLTNWIPCLIDEAGTVKGVGMERTQYAKARLLANIITVVGWLYLFIGVAGFIFSYFNDMLGFNFLPTMSAAIVGVLALAVAQLINAAVDTADNSHAILAELRKLSDASRGTSERGD